MTSSKVRWETETEKLFIVVLHVCDGEAVVQPVLYRTIEEAETFVKTREADYQNTELMNGHMFARSYTKVTEVCL